MKIKVIDMKRGIYIYAHEEARLHKNIKRPVI